MSEKELALYEKIKMCCMLKEQYDNIPQISNKISYKDTDTLTFIDKTLSKQIYVAYLYVVIEGINNSNIKIENIERFNKLKSKEYLTANGEIKTLEKILKDYRNKTFHNQNKTYYNYDKLYNVEWSKCITEVDEMIDILKNNLKNNKGFIMDKAINYYFSDFVKKVNIALENKRKNQIINFMKEFLNKNKEKDK